MWWIKHISICLLSGFVLIFGIQMLIEAYKLKNPFEFLIVFFSANLITLIGAALFFGLIYRMIRCRKDNENNNED